MSRKEKRTFWACTGGWALDAMDVQMFSFAIPAIVASGIATSYASAGLIGTATLLASAFGGWCAGALSDRLGRVLTLQITIAMFAVFAFLSAFAQSYNQLFVLRALMGLGFGGEWAAAAIVVGEVIRSADRGKAVGTMQSGWAVGWGFAAFVATLLLSTLSMNLAAEPASAHDSSAPLQWGAGLAARAGAAEDNAWRYLFGIGLLPAAVVFYVRRFVDEPTVFEDTRRNLESANKKANFLEIFSPSVLRTTILTCLLAAGAHGGYWAIMTWLPTYLRAERHFGWFGTGGYLFVVIAGSWAGYLAGAWLTDYIGRRRSFFLCATCAIVIVGTYMWLPMNDSILLGLGFPLGFFVCSVFSGIGPFFTELFPTRMRGSGQGFAYSVGRGVAASAPWLVGLLGESHLLSESHGFGLSIAVVALTAYGLMIVAARLLPETRGRELTTEAVGFAYPLPRLPRPLLRHRRDP